MIDPTQPDTTIQHALLWNSPSPSSVTDLHPGGGWHSSFAYAAAGGKQVGALMNSSSEHAVIWSGSARSFVDLHSSKFISTVAYGINGGQQDAGKQMGFGYIGSTYHALVWSGTAASVLDLHQFVPAGYPESDAFAIDALGNIVGVAGDSLTNVWHAVIWIPLQ